MTGVMDTDELQCNANNVIEKFLVIALAGLAILSFFGWKDAGPYKFFNLLSLLVLLVWRYALFSPSRNPLPKSLVLIGFLFIGTLLISALLSSQRRFGLQVWEQYRFVIMGGLLFSAPLRSNYRTFLLAIVAATAAGAGVVGILQTIGYVPMHLVRPDGFSGHPNFYSSILALVFGTVLLFLAQSRNRPYPTKTYSLVLVGVLLLTAAGIVLSQTRGVWIGLIGACAITLVLYNRAKAAKVLTTLTLICLILAVSSSMIRQRATSIVTSAFTEDVNGSTGNRLELWKGAVILAGESPLLGAGLGDFDEEINRLIAEKKIKPVNTIYHAHSIYLQALATRGIIGLVMLAMFLIWTMRWGLQRIKTHEGVGGYVIVFVTLFTAISGLTDDFLDFSKYLAVSSLVIGLAGPLGFPRDITKMTRES